MVDFNNAQQSKKIKEIRGIEEEAFIERIAKRDGFSYFVLSPTNIETDALMLIPEEQARILMVAGFKLVGRDFYLAVKSPNNSETQSLIQAFSLKYNVIVSMVSTQSLEKAWSLYADISKSMKYHGGMLDISGSKLLEIAEEIKTNSDIASKFTDILKNQEPNKTSELMEVIFAGALATESSDVHIEAQDEQVRIRFRQDGVLQDIVNLDHQAYKKLLSRIKLLSKMKITQNESAQDGRFTIDLNGEEIEVRVSVIPSAYGESFVMRLLNPNNIQVGLENLGIETRLYNILLKEIQKPNGMILTTGPTGSGKTTTLYSFMHKVYNPEVKILTIEDPIEYHLKGISQTQINRAKGYDFIAGLRAALRQDPDIIMVGEIRDKETANIAVNASLTGHLVLSTLHTNSAAGVIPRLIDLGVSPQILAAALSVSLAQRLVRKVCADCRYEIAPTEYQETVIRDILKEAVKNNKPIHEYGVSVDQKITLIEGKGCEKCNNTGYKGRLGIFEAIITDDLIEELLNKKPSEQEVRRVAEKQGLLNMREDGILKVLNQVTSFKEVQSVVDLEIKNITKTDEEQDSSEKKTNLPKIIDTQSMDPKALIGTKSVEISLLIDYLRKLEHEQTLNPETDIHENIKLVQETILDLLKHNKVEEILDASNDLAKKHTLFKGFADDLAELHNQQKQNPKIDMSLKLRRIREEMENHDKKTS